MFGLLRRVLGGSCTEGVLGVDPLMIKVPRYSGNLIAAREWVGDFQRAVSDDRNKKPPPGEA